MEEAKISILKSEMEAQIRVIDEIYKKIEIRKSAFEESQTNMESLAYQLHNLYCAFEDLFKIVADNFENTIEDKARYHIELLRRMSIPIEGIRPPLLTEDATRFFDELRSFRHLFRHAYSYEIDPRKLKIVLEDVQKLKNIYKNLVPKFIEKLK